MKKLKSVIFVLTLTLILVSVLFACGVKSDEPDGKPVYKINVKLDGNSLICSQTTVVTNVYCDGMNELTFALYPNAYSGNAQYKAYEGKLERYGGIEITEMSVNGVQTEYTLSEDNQYFTVATDDIALNGSVEIFMSYTVTLSESNLRLGKIGNAYNISNFYPQLAFYDGEKFRTDPYSTVGDPVLSPVADFFVTFDIEENLVAATPAKIENESISDGRKTFTVNGENMRDFAVVFNSDYSVVTVNAEGITVNYFYVDDSESKEHADLAARALKLFNDNFGQYPYDTYTVANTPFAADGMEFSGLVYVSGAACDLEAAIIHETAHQWWYNLVGNDNINSPWLDEGLATFSTAYYYLLNGDEERFNSEMEATAKAYGRYERLQKLRATGGMVDMSKSIYDYTEYQYAMLIYDKASLMFKSLLDTAGKDKFANALKTYVSENRFKTADAKKLADAFGKSMKCDASGLINGWLSQTAVVITFDD